MISFRSIVPLAAAIPTRNRPTPSRCSAVNAAWSRLPTPVSEGVRFISTCFERLQPPGVRGVQEELRLEESRDVIHLVVPDVPVGRGHEQAHLEHQRRAGISRIPRKPRRLLGSQERHDLIPAVGAVHDARVGLDLEADMVCRPRDRLALPGREPRALSDAVDGREVPHRHEHRSLLAGILRDDAIPIRLVGVLDSGLEVIGQGLVRLAGQNLSPPRHGPADWLQVLDAARPHVDERLELALNAHHMGDADRLDRIGDSRKIQQ